METSNNRAKKQLLNRYALEVAEALNVPFNGINYYYKPPKNEIINIGLYIDKDKTITLNEYVLLGKTDIDSYELYKTVTHELRHAYQYTAIGFYGVYGYESPHMEPASVIRI